MLGGHLALGAGAFFANPLTAATPAPLAETRLSEIAVPTLVVVGDLDDPEFVEHADTLATTVPGAQKLVIEGAGHMSPMEKPDEVNAALNAWSTAHTADDIVAACVDARVPAAIVGNGAELPRNEQLTAREVFV